MKGYKNCASCHTTPAGGTAPNDYGRAMASDWMSTWSSDYESKEFFVTESKYVDLRISYRHLFLNDPETGFTQFPMLLDGQLAVHVNPWLSGEVGLGLYSRERNLETRLSFINLKIAKKLYLRAGHFMPNFGLGTNDHSLSIKRLTGLGRGSEKYNLEIYSGYGGFDVFYTASAPDFYLGSDPESNSYHLITPDDRQYHFLKMGYNGIYRTVLGLNFQTDEVNQIYGAYLKTAPFSDPWYLLAEYDFNRLTGYGIAYARFGFYFRGIDGFLEYDQSEDKNFVYRKLFVGFDWMFRPHFQLGIKFDVLNQGKFQGQWFEWF